MSTVRHQDLALSISLTDPRCREYSGNDPIQIWRCSHQVQTHLQDHSFVRCSILQPHVAVTTCTLNCGETAIFILSTNHERLRVPKRAFYFMHTYQCKARLSLKWEDHNAGICKKPHLSGTAGMQVADSSTIRKRAEWIPQPTKKRSQMNTEACLLYTSWLWDLGNQIWSSVRYLAVRDLNLRKLHRTSNLTLSHDDLMKA